MLKEYGTVQDRKKNTNRKHRYYAKKNLISKRDRVFLHLNEYSDFLKRTKFPMELTQNGISQAVEADRAYVSKLFFSLKEEGYIEEKRKKRVSGANSKRKVYFLTAKGQNEARRIYKEIEEEKVLLVDFKSKKKEKRLRDILDALPYDTKLMDVAMHVSKGIFDLKSFDDKVRKKEAYVDLTNKMPKLRYFFNRKNELDEISRWFDSDKCKVLIIKGIAGIGKTTLIVKTVNEWKGKTNIVWYTIQEWSTLRNVLTHIANFLEKMKKRELSAYLDAKESIDMGEVFLILEEELKNVKTLFIFDDFHKAQGNLHQFSSWFMEMLERLNGVKAVIMGRKTPPFYNRKDVLVKKIVKELEIKGLEREGSMELLRRRAVDESFFEGIYQMTQGHPLFLELIDASDANSAPMLRNIEKYIDEELFSRIGDSERKLLNIASIFRRPVYMDGFFLEEGIDYDVIDIVVNHCLLYEVSYGMYDVHDIIRKYFYNRLLPKQKAKYHKLAAEYYLRRGGEEDIIESQHHFILAKEYKNAINLAVEKGDTIIQKGFSDEFTNILDVLLKKHMERGTRTQLTLFRADILTILGEWSEALKHYHRIIQLSKDIEDLSTARAYRKIGQIYEKRNRFDDALHNFKSALKIFEKIEDNKSMAEVYCDLGMLYSRRMEHDLATDYFERTMRFARRSDNKRALGRAWYGRGCIYHGKGEYEKAIGCKKKAIEILGGIGDLHSLAKIFVSVGASYYALEKDAKALEYFEESIDIAKRFGDVRTLAYAMTNAANIYIDKPDLIKAEVYLDTSIKIFEKLGEKRKVAMIYLSYGLIHKLRGRWDIAEKCFHKNIKMLEELNSLHDLAHSHFVIGQIYEGKDKRKVIDHFKSAMVISKKIKDFALLDLIKKELREIGLDDISLKEELFSIA